jgi:hypothetical protein
MSNRVVTVASFNILADGLSQGEFMCEGGDDVSTAWTLRKDRIVQVLVSMLNECDIAVTQENDHFCSLLEAIQMQSPYAIGGVFATDAAKTSTARKVKLNSQLQSIQSHVGKNASKSNVFDLYQACNDAFHKCLLPAGLAVSFAAESKEYGSTMAAAFGCKEGDLFSSNDGIGIYYRADRVTLADVHVPGLVECEKVQEGILTIVTNADSCIRANFRLGNDSNSHSQITVYGAHLKSGEDYSSEIKRCRQLELLLDDAQSQPFPIIAMDSNNSIHYEHNYLQNSTRTGTEEEDRELPLTLSCIIAERGYVNAVGPPYQDIGNECFKLRHGLGAQVSKHFQFMFDAIDKILVPQSALILPVVYEREKFGFQRCDPALREGLLQLRASAEERRAFEEQCRASERVRSTTCAVEAFGLEHLLRGLYPNPRAPSDHPPVYCRLQLPLV